MAQRQQPGNAGLEKLKEAFLNFDNDKDGYLTHEELRYILGGIGETLPEEEVKLISFQLFNSTDRRVYKNSRPKQSRVH